MTVEWFCVMGVVIEWFLTNDFWMSMYVWWSGVSRFYLLSDWFLNNFVWWSGFWMIFEWFILGFQNDFSTIFVWFRVKEWFLGIIAWSHIDFWMVVCDGMIFDDLVRVWNDFVWWKWFWTVLDDFAMIFECFCVVAGVLEWFSNCFLICDSKMILCDGVGNEWFLKDSWMILCDGGVLEWFLNDWLVTFDYAWWNGFWMMFEQFLLVFQIIFEWVCHRMLSCHLLLILPDFVWCSCYFSLFLQWLCNYSRIVLRVVAMFLFYWSLNDLKMILRDGVGAIFECYLWLVNAFVICFLTGFVWWNGFWFFWFF